MVIDYIYYKFFQAALKSSVKDIPHVAASAWLGGIIAANIFVVVGFLAKITETSLIFSSPQQGGWMAAVLIVIAFLYYGKDRRDMALKKYSEETNRQRVKGNVIVSVYVGLSFLLIFAVAFFKPGYLPR